MVPPSMCYDTSFYPMNYITESPHFEVLVMSFSHFWHTWKAEKVVMSFGAAFGLGAACHLIQNLVFHLKFCQHSGNTISIWMNIWSYDLDHLNSKNFYFHHTPYPETSFLLTYFQNYNSILCTDFLLTPNYSNSYYEEPSLSKCPCDFIFLTCFLKWHWQPLLPWFQSHSLTCLLLTSLAVLSQSAQFTPLPQFVP